MGDGWHVRCVDDLMRAWSLGQKVLAENKKKGREFEQVGDEREMEEGGVTGRGRGWGGGDAAF